MTGPIAMCLYLMAMAIAIAIMVIRENNREARKHDRELKKQARKESKLRQAYSLTNGKNPSINEAGEIFIDNI